MSEVTQILARVEQGDPEAPGQLIVLIYDELRALAKTKLRFERLDHTLQATALVHEAYIRMFGGDQDRCWTGRRHFLRHAAKAMREILVGSARAKRCQKRGGLGKHTELEDIAESEFISADMILDLDDGISLLAEEDADAAELVKLRFFAGLSVSEAGDVLGMPRSTAYENWKFARCWFARRSRD